MKQMRWVFLVMLASLFIALWGWDSIPIIKDTVHAVLTPTLGALIIYNKYLGMITVAVVVSLATVALQKYTIDRETMKGIKDEQKKLRELKKEFKDHPEKQMEIAKKEMELVMQSLPLTMRPVIFTAIPFILLFRWLGDFYGPGGLYEGAVFLGFMSWLWFYLLLVIISSQVFRKWFDVI